METTNINGSPTMQTPTNRYTQNSPHQTSVATTITSTATSNPLHTIAQPYPGENSNFGAFYHHHSHMPSYGNPYDKFKIPANVHSRSSNSPYGGYQGFYSTAATHHHHHQMVRPNGYIDLVPR